MGDQNFNLDGQQYYQNQQQNQQNQQNFNQQQGNQFFQPVTYYSQNNQLGNQYSPPVNYYNQNNQLGNQYSQPVNYYNQQENQSFQPVNNYYQNTQNTQQTQQTQQTQNFYQPVPVQNGQGFVQQTVQNTGGVVPAGPMNQVVAQNVPTNLLNQRRDQVQMAQPERQLEEREKKEWEYLKKRAREEVEPGSKSLNNGQKLTLVMQKLSDLSVILDSDTTVSKSKNVLRDKLNGFLTMITDQTFGNKTLKAAAEELILTAQTYREKHSFLFFHAKKYKEAGKIMDAVKEALQLVGLQAEENRADEVSEWQFDKAYSLAFEKHNSDIKNNRYQDSKEVQDLLAEQAQQQTQQQGSKKKAKPKKKTKADLKREAKEKDAAFAAEWSRVTANYMTVAQVSGNWTEYEKKRYVEMVRISELYCAAIGYSTAINTELQRWMQKMRTGYNSNDLQQHNAAIDINIRKMNAVVEVLTRQDSRFAGDKIYESMRDQLQKHALETRDKMLEAREDLEVKFKAPKTKVVESQKPLLDSRDPKTAQARAQVKTVHEIVRDSKDPVTEPADLTEMLKDPARFQLITKMNGQDHQFLAQEWEKLKTANPKVAAIVKKKGMSTDEIHRFVALKEAQEAARYGAQKIEELKKKMAAVKVYSQDQRKEFKQLFWEASQTSEYIRQLKHKYQFLLTDTVYQARLEQLANSISEYYSSIQFTYLQNLQEHTERGQKKKSDMEREMAEHDNYEKKVKFSKKGVKKGADPQKLEAYNTMLHAGDGLDLSMYQDQLELIKRMKEYRKNYGKTLNIEDLTQKEFDELKKVNYLGSEMLLNRRRLQDKFPGGQIPQTQLAQQSKSVNFYKMSGTVHANQDGSVLSNYAWIQLQDQQSPTFLDRNKLYTIYPNPMTHSNYVPSQGFNNTLKFAGNCSLASSALAINQMFNGIDVTNENLNTNLTEKLGGYIKHTYQPKRDSTGEIIKENNEVVYTEERRTDETGGTPIQLLERNALVFDLDSEMLTTSKNVQEDGYTLCGKYGEALKQGNCTLLLTVHAGLLLNGVAEKSKLGQVVPMNHTINVCSAVYDGGMLMGFMIKNTGANSSDLYEDVEPEAQYTFVDVHRMALAMRGDGNVRVTGHDCLKLTKKGDTL